LVLRGEEKRYESEVKHDWMRFGQANGSERELKRKGGRELKKMAELAEKKYSKGGLNEKTRGKKRLK